MEKGEEPNFTDSSSQSVPSTKCEVMHLDNNHSAQPNCTLSNKKTHEDEKQDEIPYFTDRSNKPKRKYVQENRQIFKLWVTDILNMSFNSTTYMYQFKDKTVKRVMCSGFVRRVIKKPERVSFILDDGTGTIQCFYKPKPYHKWLMDEELQSTNNTNEEKFSEAYDLSRFFNSTMNYTSVKNKQEAVTVAENKLANWFRNVAKKNLSRVVEVCNPEDVVRVIGYPFELGPFRRIQVATFHVVDDLDEETDFAMELCALHQNIYNKVGCD